MQDMMTFALPTSISVHTHKSKKILEMHDPSVRMEKDGMREIKDIWAFEPFEEGTQSMFFRGFVFSKNLFQDIFEAFSWIMMKARSSSCKFEFDDSFKWALKFRLKIWNILKKNLNLNYQLADHLAFNSLKKKAWKIVKFPFTLKYCIVNQLKLFL